MPDKHLPPLAAAAAGMALAATLAGCSAAPVDPDGARASAGASDGFPVTIASSLGSATIEQRPARVVTIGQGSADTVVALGTTPVGVEVDSWGGDGDGYQPWLREALEESGEELPALITATPEVDVEGILELEPDLILAPQSGITQADFDLLSAVAPTVAYPGDAWSTPWDEQIRIIGQALGESDDAEAIVRDIRDELRAVADQNPQFEGTTFSYLYTGEPGVLGVFQAGEPRVDILTGMGLTVDPVIAEQPVTPGTSSSLIGLERADILNDSDLVFTWFSDPDQQAAIEAQPLYAQIPAVRRGSDVVSYDRSFVTASSLITPLTVPWVLADFVPRIQDAVAVVSNAPAASE
ncbi:iron-siderophore ABC transporter substrate-binding protein [Compostimonas suwonensis]|uniref:Iron complex transport system substrate-binding protein n=1 Tax=Compostimonas suwonensis TaxID=1048394 RepID=A0A2M9BUK0_9MICO|nr:iron-siderophore ABC transporter substrate-binding protein [Compostimonas suwonensis]PJJ61625.1 iron complex transport system substrate-binding protein [Compostimonas suwonensis]